ncbi:MAG: YiiX/YebB-like N1pC/P60 family cysteine hydrolase [Paracraurococcus sp.]
MAWIDTQLDRLGNFIARRIVARDAAPERALAALGPYARVLRPGDVLLVDGGANKVSSAIKYLTQSTWSHAALFTGAATPAGEPMLIEAELGLGIVESPLRKYAGYHLRICRPVGLEDAALAAVIDFARSRLGGRYDLRNVLDLARWLVPQPPVPKRFRRRLIALGSGEPTRAICASLIADAFNRVGYPILPEIAMLGGTGTEAGQEVLHVRHHSLYAPRDFDVSPYFAIVKPTLEQGFDHRCLPWADRRPPEDCHICHQTVQVLARA